MHKRLCWLCLAVECLAWFGSRAQSRGFTVRDDITMVRFNDPSALEKNARAKFSSDGKYCAVVTSRGIIESNEIESTITIYEAASIAAFLTANDSAPIPLPRMKIVRAAVLHSKQYDPYGPVIADLRWSMNSRYLYFLADGTRNERRLYRADVARKTASALTPEGYHVDRYDFTNNVVAYSAWRTAQISKNIKAHEDDRINAEAREVTGESLMNILFPHDQLNLNNRELWTVRIVRGHPLARRVSYPPQHDISSAPEAFSISPSGRRLIRLQPTTYVPSDWAFYEPAQGAEFLRIREGDSGVLASNNISRLKEYSLINLDGGPSAPLLQAPHGYTLGYTYESKAIWAPDEQRVLLTNTFLPLAGVDAKERQERLTPCAVVEVELPSREPHCLLFASELPTSHAGGIMPDSISFGRNENEVTFAVGCSEGGSELRKYALENGMWRLTKGDTTLDRDDRSEINRCPRSPNDDDASFKVTVDQGLNEPPTLWATNVRTGQTKELLDPNPQFAHLAFGEASVYQWRDKSGHEWKGGLIKPVGYVPGKRYPLVIQIYNFDDAQFLTDGEFPTAMAARALASAGIVVLQLQRKLPHTFDIAEADAQLAGIESAIDRLGGDGLVDPQRVGLVGFSSTCWYVENALIRDPKLLKAATIADGIDISYMQYRLWGVSNLPLEQEFERIVGSKPFGTGLKQWLQLAPGFHLDQVVTPLRIEATTPDSVLGEWEIYSSLRQQGRPVDLIYFPEGQHIHQRPLERLASQEGDVDWFRFWLAGYEDSDPAKRDQYKLWESMMSDELVKR